MGTYSRPVRGGRVSQNYGNRNRGYSAGYHTGIDYAVPVGTPIYAAAPGRVVAVGSAGSYGIRVEIAHAGKVWTMYAHMSRASVKKGDTVWAGQRIGSSGNTGNSSGPHLHFELRKGSNRYRSNINPNAYLNRKAYGNQIPTGSGAATTTAGGARAGGSRSAASDVDRALRNAGFTGRNYQIAWAVMMAESGGNPYAHNGNRNTGDNSYGLFQINMLGAMGPERRRQYGLGSNGALFDPDVNARVAWKMSKGGTDWSPWSAYKNGTYRRYLNGAPAAPVGDTTTVGEKKYTWTTVDQKKYTWEKAQAEAVKAVSEVDSPVDYQNPVDSVAGSVGAPGTYTSPTEDEELPL